MATINKPHQVSRISTISISGIIQKIASYLRSSAAVPEEIVPAYTDDDYYRDIARAQVQKRIEAAKYSVHSHRGM